MAAAFVESDPDSEKASFPTVVLAIQGELVFSRNCFLETGFKFFPFLKNKTPITDYLQVHVCEVVLHILPEMFVPFISELQIKQDLSKVLNRDFIKACLAGFSKNERTHPCLPIDPAHKLDHAESEYNWSIAEPFFLSHQLQENDLHSYQLKPEYKDTEKFSRFDNEIYVYIKNWVENATGKLDLNNIKSWKKVMQQPQEQFMFSHCVPDKTEIKLYLCTQKDGRLIKTTPQRLMEIPLK